MGVRHELQNTLELIRGNKRNGPRGKLSTSRTRSVTGPTAPIASSVPALSGRLGCGTGSRPRLHLDSSCVAVGRVSTRRGSRHRLRAH